MVKVRGPKLSLNGRSSPKFQDILMETVVSLMLVANNLMYSFCEDILSFYKSFLECEDDF